MPLMSLFFIAVLVGADVSGRAAIVAFAPVCHTHQQELHKGGYNRIATGYGDTFTDTNNVKGKSC